MDYWHKDWKCPLKEAEHERLLAQGVHLPILDGSWKKDDQVRRRLHDLLPGELRHSRVHQPVLRKL